MRRFILVALIALAAPAQAQDAARQESGRTRRESQATERAAAAADASVLLPSLGEGDRVTYAEVLANPDDIALNYRYAQTRIREGDLVGATATLERILMIEPGLVHARLLYAVILYRQDNLIESKREFDAISELELPERIRREVDAFLEDIEHRSQRTRLSGRMTIGFQFDSNRNGAPRSNNVIAGGAKVSLSNGKREQKDFGFVSILGGTIEHDLDSQAGHTLFGSVEYFGQEQAQEDQFDILSAAVEGGTVFRTPYADVVPRVRFEYMSLDFQTFVMTFGGEIEARRHVSKDLQLTAVAGIEREEFRDLNSTSRLGQRTGLRWGVGGGGTYQIGPSHIFDFGIRYIDKSAEKRWWAYRGAAVAGALTWLLGQGQFVSAMTAYEHDWYRRSNPTINSTQRRDDLWRTRFTYGAPLQTLCKSLGESNPLSDVLASISGEYLRGASNIKNYEYDNFKVALMFTKRWRR